MPFQSALGAVYLDPQVVLASVRNLRGGDGAEGALLIANGGDAIVIQRPPSLEGLEQAGNLVGQQASDEAAEVVGVRADVAEAAGRPGALRVGAPAGLFL